MDFAKFISLLEEGALFFNRTNTFEDPFDGRWPQLNIQQLEYWIENDPDKRKDSTIY